MKFEKLNIIIFSFAAVALSYFLVRGVGADSAPQSVASSPPVQVVYKVPEKEPVAPPKNPDDIVYTTEYGHKYHKLGCSYIAKKEQSELEEWPAEIAAEEGYSPCTLCIKE